MDQVRAVPQRQVAPLVWWLVLLNLAAGTASAQNAVTLDHAAEPGRNYDRAEFRLWYPADMPHARAIVVLMPGSNEDGRPEVGDAAWQDFATRHQLALLGCRYTDKPHEQDFIEEYVNVAHGSGQALLDALTAFATRSSHAELTHAPLLLWGLSAGGEFNYEFVAWQPDRVVGFVVNKGGIYYSALLPAAARQVPGLLFVGQQDIAFRNDTILGLFTVNRRAGALWALVKEPGIGHAVGRSRDLALLFFEEIVPLRVPPSSPNASESNVLLPLDERSGFLGDLTTGRVASRADARTPEQPTAWLPTERLAHAWQRVVTDKPDNSAAH